MKKGNSRKSKLRWRRKKRLRRKKKKPRYSLFIKTLKLYNWSSYKVYTILHSRRDNKTKLMMIKIGKIPSLYQKRDISMNMTIGLMLRMGKKELADFKNTQ